MGANSVVQVDVTTVEKSNRVKTSLIINYLLEKSVGHLVCIDAFEALTQVVVVSDHDLNEVIIGKELEHYLFVPKIINQVTVREEVLPFNFVVQEELIKLHYDDDQPLVLA